MGACSIKILLISCVLIGAAFMGEAAPRTRRPRPKGMATCQQECKDQPGSPNSICGVQGRGMTIRRFRNQCEIDCMNIGNRHHYKNTPNGCDDFPDRDKANKNKNNGTRRMDPIKRCREECKDKPGDSDSMCGTLATEGRTMRDLFRNQCEIDCMKYKTQPMKECVWSESEVNGNQTLVGPTPEASTTSRGPGKI